MKSIVKKDFNGIKVAFEGKENISLTDLWKAAGGDTLKRPAHWMQQDETRLFVSSVIKNLNVRQDDIIKTTRGKGGGTWAHWQIALAYAKYLSPELHMFVNQVFMERVEEENNPDLALDRGLDRATNGYKKQGKTDEWIKNRMYSKIATKENNKVLAKHGDDSRVYSLCADALNVEIIGMKSSQFKQANNLPKSASIRDSFSSIQLLEMALANEVSKQRIQEDAICGNQSCANVHSVIAGRVHKAVTMRGV